MKTSKGHKKRISHQRITQNNAQSMQSSSQQQSHNVQSQSEEGQQSQSLSGIQKFHNYNELFQLKSTINELTLQNNNIHYQYSNLVEAYKQLQAIHIECVSQNNSLKQTLDNVKEDNQILINQIQSIKNAMTKVSNININDISQQFQQELQKKDSTIQKMSEQIKTLLNEINKQKNQSQKSDSRRQDIQTLQADIQRLKKQLVVSKQHYEKMLEQKDQIIKKFSEQNQSHYKNILQTKNKTIQSLQEQLKGMKNALQKYQEEYHRQKQFRQKLQNEFQTKIYQIKSQVDESILKQQQKEKQIRQRESQKTKNENNKEQVIEQQFNKILKQKQEQISKARQLQQSLVQQLYSTNVQLNKHKSQLASLEQFNQYLQKNNIEIQAKKKDVQNQLYQKEKQLIEVKDANFNESLQFKRQIVSLKKIADQNNENSRQREKERNSISSQVQRSEQKLNQAKQRIFEVQNKLKQNEDNYRKIRFQNEILHNQKMQLICKNDKLQIQQNKLYEKIQQLHQQKINQSQRQKQNDAYRHSYPEDSKKQNLNLKETIHKLELKIQEKNQKMMKLQTNLREEYKSRIQALQRHIYQLQLQKDQKYDQNNKSKKQIKNKLFDEEADIEQLDMEKTDEEIQVKPIRQQIKMSRQNSVKSKESKKQTNKTQTQRVMNENKIEIQNMRKQLNKFGQQLNEKQRKNQTNLQQIQRLQSIVQLLKLQKEESQQKISKIKKQLSEKQSMIFDKDMKLTENNRKINELQQDNKNYQSIHDQINQRYKKGIQTFKNQINSMNEELIHQKNNFQAKKRQMKKIQQEFSFKISQLNDQNYTLKNKVKKQEIQIITLEGQLKQAEQQQIQSVVISRTALVNYKNTQIRLQELEEEIKKMVKQKNELISQKRTLQEYYSEEMMIIKSNNNNQRQKLIRRLTQTQEIKGDYQIKLKKIHQLLQEKRKENLDYELTCEKLSKQNYCIKIQLSEALSEVNSTLVKNKTIMAKYQQISNKYDELHLVYESLAKSKNKWETNMSQAQGMKSELQMAYKQIDTLNRVLMQKEREIKFYLNQPQKQFYQNKQYQKPKTSFRNQSKQNYNIESTYQKGYGQNDQQKWQNQSQFSLNQNYFKNSRQQTNEDASFNFKHYKKNADNINIDQIYPINKTFKQNGLNNYQKNSHICNKKESQEYQFEENSNFYPNLLSSNNGNFATRSTEPVQKKYHHRSQFYQNKMIGGFPIEYCTFAPSYHKI